MQEPVQLLHVWHMDCTTLGYGLSWMGIRIMMFSREGSAFRKDMIRIAMRSLSTCLELSMEWDL